MSVLLWFLCISCIKHVQMPCARVVASSIFGKLLCSLWFGLHSPNQPPETKNRRWHLGSIALDNPGLWKTLEGLSFPTFQCPPPPTRHLAIVHLRQTLRALKHESPWPGLHISPKCGLTLRRIKPSPVVGELKGCEETVTFQASNLSVSGSVLGTRLGDLLEKGNT